MSYHIGSFNIRDFNYSSQDSKGERIKRDFEKISELQYYISRKRHINNPKPIKKNKVCEVKNEVSNPETLYKSRDSGFSD